MPTRFSRYLHGALSLKGRLLLGLLVIWTLVVALLLGFGWRSGEALVGDSSRTHLRYEARLIADELTQQVETRLSALERLADRLDAADAEAEAAMPCARVMPCSNGSMAWSWPMPRVGSCPTGESRGSGRPVYRGPSVFSACQAFKLLTSVNRSAGGTTVFLR